MTVTEQVKILDDKIRANKLNMILIDKQLKHLHYQVVN